ncbi:MAG: cytochrome ubiquinol oxidase subunit I, partial [Actinomycetota bacterium]
SFLAKGDPDAEIMGLKEVPRPDRPNTTVVHISFQLMVSIGFGLLGLGGWAGWSRWRRKKLPSSSLFLKAVVASGPASFVAIETGWMVTEIGRQPWIVQGFMRVKDAVTTNPGIVWHLIGTVVIYVLLAAACTYLLLKLASDARSRGDAPGPGTAAGRES